MQKSRFISGEHMIDGIRQRNVETWFENLVNLNFISCVNLSSRGIAIARLLYSSGFSEGVLLRCCCLMVVCGIYGVTDGFILILIAC